MRKFMNVLVIALSVSAVIGLTAHQFGQAQANDSDSDHFHCGLMPSNIPPAIAPPANECLKTSVKGVGVQIYTCTAGAWSAAIPEANLMRDGDFVGNHFFSPAWQWKDGSKIHARKTASVNAPDPTSDIPWLLLTVFSEDGDGHLKGTTSVNRIDTKGGVAPPLPCLEGVQVRIPYTANYLFYHVRG
jgi:hypothetical protein